MTTDLEAAVARLKVMIAGDWSDLGGALPAHYADLRLLLADWERLRELELAQCNCCNEPACCWRERSMTAEAERDAARAEVERLKADLKFHIDIHADTELERQKAQHELDRLRESVKEGP